MRFPLIIFLVLSLCVLAIGQPPQPAQSVRLTWTFSGGTNVASYNAYWGVVTNTFSSRQTGIITNYFDITNATPLTNYFAVVSGVDTNGLESIPAVANTNAAPPPPVIVQQNNKGLILLLR